MPWVFYDLDNCEISLRNSRDDSVIHIEYADKSILYVSYQGTYFYIRREALSDLLKILDSDDRDKFMKVVEIASKIETYTRIADNITNLVESWNNPERREFMIRRIKRGVNLSEKLKELLTEVKHILDDSLFKRLEYKKPDWIYPYFAGYYRIERNYLILTKSLSVGSEIYAVKYIGNGINGGSAYKEGKITYRGLIDIFEGRDPKMEEKEIPETLKEGLAHQNPEKFGVFSDYIKRLQAEMVLRKV